MKPVPQHCTESPHPTSPSPPELCHAHIRQSATIASSSSCIRRPPFSAAMANRATRPDRGGGGERHYCAAGQGRLLKGQRRRHGVWYRNRLPDLINLKMLGFFVVKKVEGRSNGTLPYRLCPPKVFFVTMQLGANEMVSPPLKYRPNVVEFLVLLSLALRVV